MVHIGREIMIRGAQEPSDSGRTARSPTYVRTNAQVLPRGVKTFPARLPSVANTQPKLPALLTGWLWWILPLIVFGAIAAALWLLKVGGVGLPAVILVTTLFIGFGWIIVSALHPAQADRTCPECGEEALERLDPETTRGVRCSSCGYIDRDESSWFLAEEETVLEEIVLRERARVAGLKPEELSNAESDSSEADVKG